MIKAVKLEELPQIIRGRLGLIVGPAVTLYPSVLPRSEGRPREIIFIPPSE